MKIIRPATIFTPISLHVQSIAEARWLGLVFKKAIEHLSALVATKGLTGRALAHRQELLATAQKLDAAATQAVDTLKAVSEPVSLVIDSEDAYLDTLMVLSTASNALGEHESEFSLAIDHLRAQIEQSTRADGNYTAIIPTEFEEVMDRVDAENAVDAE